MLRALAVWAATVVMLPAQRLHNPDSEAAAQRAAKLTEGITSSEIFRTQLRNLEIMSQQDIDHVLLGARREMRADVDSFSRWDQLDDYVCGKAAQLGRRPSKCPPPAVAPPVVSAEEIKKAQAALQQQVQELENANKKTGKSVKDKEDSAVDQALQQALDRLDQLPAVLEQGRKLLKLDEPSAKTKDEIEKATRTLGELQGAYDRYNGILESVQKEEKLVADLKVPLQKLALERLKVEQEHWTRTAALQARRLREEEDLQRVLALYANTCSGVGGKGEIQAILNDLRGDRNRLHQAVLCLQTVAALAASAALPAKLERLRMAQEQRRYSIELSAVNARSYELTVSTGLQRLALFYRGGIRPEQIARLMYYAASIATPLAVTYAQ